MARMHGKSADTEENREMDETGQIKRQAMQIAVQSTDAQDSTLVPMLIGGLVLIVIGMVCIAWLV
jgi:hypothetical protein